MSKVATIPVRSQAQPTWTSVQAYVLAAFCLLLGVALGYLFRGSASPAAEAATAAAASTSPVTAPEMANLPTPEQQKAMLSRATAPLLDALKVNPTDFETLVKLGNVYYDAHQYPEAIQYYQRALQVNPKDADVRTDVGTAYWYSGNADKAIESFEASLKINPNHPGTLFNMGVVKWQGKSDPAGAVAAWQELLKRNPNYPQRDQIEQFIAKAREHSKS